MPHHIPPLQEKPVVDIPAQIPFDDVQFSENPEPRCPCVLLLDRSYSMSGQKISALNEGLMQLKKELDEHSLARKRVEVAVVTFGPVEVSSNFQAVDNFYPPTLVAAGNTPMCAAIAKSFELLKERKEVYRRNGISFFRPWVILITDGEPTDPEAIEAAKSSILEAENNKSVAFFPIAVDNADMEVLQRLSVRAPVKLKGVMFNEFFVWLSNSLRAVSSSSPGETVPIPAPTGWNEV